MLLSSGAFTYFWRPPPETKAGDVPSTEDSGVEHFGLGRVAGAAVIVARCTSGGGRRGASKVELAATATKWGGYLLYHTVSIYIAIY